MTDFEVGNIQCAHCGRNLFFSHIHSSEWIAVFYCVNAKCDFDHFYVHMDESHHQHISLVKE